MVVSGSLLHGVRHVRCHAVPQSLGAPLQVVPGHRVCHRFQRPNEASGRQRRAGAAAAAPGHCEPPGSDTVLCQQDGLCGRVEQREDCRWTGLGEDQGQAVAHQLEQRADRGGPAGRSAVDGAPNSGVRGQLEGEEYVKDCEREGGL
uniref:(northern house mosquito) hypothetical protein n=1 Tax=Culex pipiens TaxID=7175 RepID=A0A8D8FGJ9_CULPI